MYKVVFLILAVILLSSCANKTNNTLNGKSPKDNTFTENTVKEYIKFYKEFVKKRKKYDEEIKTNISTKKTEVEKIPPLLKNKITTNAQSLPYEDIINILSISSGVYIYTDRKILFPVSLNLKDTPLYIALKMITNPYGFEYKITGPDSVKIITYDTKVFKVYAPSVLRKATSNLSSSLSGATDQESGSTGDVRLTNDIDINFWQNIETTLKTIIRDEEKTTVSISYTDTKQVNINENRQKQNQKQGITQSQHKEEQKEEKNKELASQLKNKSDRKKKEGEIPLASRNRGVQSNINELLPKKKAEKTKENSQNYQKTNTKNKEQNNVKQEQRAKAENINTQNTITKNVNIQQTFQIQKSYNPFVQIDKNNGIIVVKARPKTLKKIENYLNTLNKIMNKQILIELEIVNFTQSKSLEVGINWDAILRSTLLADAKITMVQNLTSPKENGFNAKLVKYDGDFEAFLAALSLHGNVSVISSPRITTLNNQPAIIRIGSDKVIVYTQATRQVEQLQNIQGQVQISSITVQKTHIVSEGFTLFVLPQYEETTHNVILNIVPIIQSLDEKSKATLDEQLQKMIITDPTKFQTSPVPLTIQTKQINAIAKVRDGEVVVLGGLTENSINNSQASTPFISKLPLFGNLFKYKKKQKNKSYLIFLLKVNVL